MGNPKAFSKLTILSGFQKLGSFFKGGTSEFPGVYTKVTAIMDWLESIVQNETICTVSV